MAQVKLKGNAIHTVGDLPQVGSTAPDFKLVKTDLSEVGLSDFGGKQIVLNIFPSVDTGTCAASVRKFNEEAASMTDAVVVCVSGDLPFAHARFCGAEGLENVVNLSTFRDADFGKNYGVTFVDGPLKGLLSRAVVVIDPSGKIVHTELVPEIVDEPDYNKAIEALQK